MKQLLWKVFIIFIVFNLAVSQTMPVLAQENTPEPPTESPTPTPTETETPTPEETPFPTVTLTNDATAIPLATTSPEIISTPSISIIEIKAHATPETIKPDGKITIHWEIFGISQADSTLTLQLALPSNFAPENIKEEVFDSQTRMISQPLSTLSGTFYVQALSEITEDAVFYLSIVDSAQTVLGANQLTLPLREKFEVDKNGGEITTRDGELKVKFSSGSLKNEGIEVEIGNPSGNNLLYSLSGKPFEIKAKAKKDGAELKQFEEEVEFIINLDAYGISKENNDTIQLYWYNPETNGWYGLTSWVDDETNTLHGVTNHFSIFDIGVNNWEASKKPSVNAFQVSTFTGAATYSLPIELPAGPGGFQPSLSLNYNSQIIDQSTTWSQAGWVGAGWSLDTGFIELNSKNDYDPNNDSYSLSFNGISTEIINTTQGWKLAHENFMKVSFDGNKWVVWDKQGTFYEFEQKTIMRVSGSCDSLVSYTNKWSLTKVKNKFGQEINYAYTTETKNIKYMVWSAPHNQCRKYGIASTDTATYPATITYAGGRVRVRFELEPRSDYNLDYLNDEIHHSFERSRLDYLVIEQDLDDNGSFESILRKYDLTYSTSTNKVWPNAIFSAGASLSTLSSIKEYGLNGTNSLLPATTFIYGDAMHLTEANNGYGGGVTFNYEAWYYPTPQESYKREWNDMGGTGFLVVAGTGNQLPYSAGGPIKPGGAYLLNVVIRPGDSGYLRLYDGTSYQTTGLVSGTASEVFYLPKTASIYSQGHFYNPNGWHARLYYSNFAALTTIYRVTSKTISDSNTNSQDLISTYTYNDATVNTASNISVMNASNTLVSLEPYAEKYSQFFGHSKVTIIEPDGITKTIIEYHQTEELKGREKSTSIEVNNLKRNVSTPSYSFVSLPGFIYNTKGIARYWVKLDNTIQQVYNNSGGLNGQTRTIYTYESTYGNLLTQTEQTWDGSVGTDYRKTEYYYVPNDSTTRYLVSLPAKTKIYDGAGATLGITLYLYDDNTGAQHMVIPTNGKLTAVRTWIESANWSQVNYHYDDWGNQDQVTMYDGYVVYDASSVPTGARTTTTEYDSVFHTYPIKVTNALGQFSLIDYDYTQGLPTCITPLLADSSSATSCTGVSNHTAATYDAYGRITKIIRPGGTTTNPTLYFSYLDWFPFTTYVSQKIDNTNTYYTVIRYYDGIGRVTKTVSGGTVVDTIYQSATVIKQSVPYIGVSPNQFTTTTVNPTANSVTVTAADGTFTTTATNGLVTTFTDAKNQVTTSTSDIWGRVVQVSPPTGPSISYEYDVLNRLKTTIRGGATTQIFYDMIGRKTRMIDPDMKNWSYTYDALGNLTQQTDAKEQVTCLQYDELNRLTQKGYYSTIGSCSTVNYSIQYGYDAGTNGVGHRTSMTDLSGSTSWIYDNRGRMIKETKNIDSQTFVTEYGYNTANLLTWIKYPGSTVEQVNYTYNDKMLLNTVIGDSTYVSSTNYDTVGRLTSRALGNTLTQSYNYYLWNETALVDGVQTGQGGRLKNMSVNTTLQNHLYTYDANGNIKTISDSSETQTFSYDPLNRLVSANATGAQAYSETYSYDPTTGNLLTKNNNIYTYSDAHRHAVTSLTDGNVYLYDANGNMTTRYVNNIQYDMTYNAEGQMTNVTSSTPSTAPMPMEEAPPVPGAPPVSVFEDVPHGSTYKNQIETIFARGITAGCNTNPLRYCPSNTITRAQMAVLILRAKHGGSYTPPAVGTSTGFNDVQTNHPYAAWIKQFAAEGFTSGCGGGNFCPDTNVTRGQAAVFILRAKYGSSYVPPPVGTSTGFNDVQTNHAFAAWIKQLKAEGAVNGCGGGNFCPDVSLSREQVAYFLVSTFDWELVAEPQPVVSLPAPKAHALMIFFQPASTITNATFTYDGDGKRVKSVINGVTTYFVGTHYEVTGSEVTKYYYAGSQRIAMRKNGVLSYILGDHLGSTSLVTDSNGAVISETKYKAWGEIRYSSSTNPTDYTFTGQYSYTSDFGLMFYNARWYDPSLGRFAQADTLVPDLSNSQSWDRYAYTFNNPVLYNDPSGHVPTCQPGTRCLVPIADERDLTAWIVAAAVDIVESPEMKSVSYSNHVGLKGSAYVEFFTLVSDGAKYDVKDNIKLDLGEDTKIGNEWYEYSTAGNILYGFYGAAAGFTEAELRAGAGIAQMLDYYEDPSRGKGPCSSPYFCDTEVDYYAVGFGMYLYNNYYKDDQKLTEQDLLDAFKSYEYSKNMDIKDEPNDFRPRYYNYPTNRFYNIAQ